MRDFTSDKIKTIKPSGIRKFFDIVNKIPDCVSLGVGEPDFETPWHITEEGIYSLERGRTFYTSNQGLPELREEISKWNKRKYGLKDYGNLFPVHGGVLDRLDSVIMVAPMTYLYLNFIGIFG